VNGQVHCTLGTTTSPVPKPYNTHSTMFEQTFKSIDDILHKDAGCTSELDYTK